MWLGFAILVVLCSGSYAKRGMLRSGVNDQKQQILAGSGAGAAPGSGAGAAPTANGVQPNQQPAVVPMVVPTTQLVSQNHLAPNQGIGVCISVKKCNEIQ